MTEHPAPRPDAAALRASFAAVYGRGPAGVWAAPGRVNLIGEHTDHNDGLVMPIALPHAVYAAAAPRSDGRVRLSTSVADGLVEIPLAELLTPEPPRHRAARWGWAAYPAGALWALARAGVAPGGVDLRFDSTVPVGAGLSSSAALEVATVRALADLRGAGSLTGERVAEIARRAENEVVGVPCGVMDQMASACCRAGHALLLDTRDMLSSHVPLDFAASGLALLVVDTGVSHDLGDGGYAERRERCAEAARALGVDSLRAVEQAGLRAALDRLAADPAVRPEAARALRHVVTENERVRRVAALASAGRLAEIGPVLVAGHASLRDDFEVSTPELDLVVRAAGAAGALGARMTGGGFGGSAIVLIGAADRERVEHAVHTAFAAAGHAPPRVFPATPAAGAERLPGGRGVKS
ncbi:galactokinase (plasmid) [Streptomyces sp. BI20]|uniref:galactokinase n=1 Tax=Streptomyces sp. BI20 TaxID=3403460 RepID=UPI003C7163D8